MSVQRVIFVGLHNKPGMKPLDSRTKSGKLIDRIIEQLRHKGMNILRTNLFDVDEVPAVSEMDKLAFDWIERVELYKEDIIVLLGQMVHDNFPKIPLIKVIKVAHPASKRSHVDMNDYVDKTVNIITAMAYHISHYHPDPDTPAEEGAGDLDNDEDDAAEDKRIMDRAKTDALISQWFDKWCEDTKRGGGVLITTSIKELLIDFYNFLNTKNR